MLHDTPSLPSFCLKIVSNNFHKCPFLSFVNFAYHLYICKATVSYENTQCRFSSPSGADLFKLFIASLISAPKLFIMSVQTYKHIHKLSSEQITHANILIASECIVHCCRSGVNIDFDCNEQRKNCLFPLSSKGRYRVS